MSDFDASQLTDDDEDEKFMRFIADTCERQRLEKEEEEEERQREQQGQEQEQRRQDLEQQERQQQSQPDAQPDTQQVTSEDSPETTSEVDPNSFEARINRTPAETMRLRREEMICAWEEEMAERQRQHEKDCMPQYMKW